MVKAHGHCHNYSTLVDDDTLKGQEAWFDRVESYIFPAVVNATVNTICTDCTTPFG